MLRSVLIVDDDASMRHLLSVILNDRGYEAAAVATAEDGLKELAARGYDLVLTDLRMPGMGGLALVRELQRRTPDQLVIVMSAYGTHDTAVEAMKAGAYDYLPKPFKPDDVVLVLRKAEERERLARENRRLRSELGAAFPIDGLVVRSEAVQELVRQVRRVAPQKTTVLLQGESGTGKELFARALHDLSPRASFPFVAVNCGAIPAELLESELFGHVKGAFTDARRDKKGLAAEADGGTLFLDEVAELPLLLQVKLLRFLQDGVLERVGGTESVRVDVRVVAATNRALSAEVKAGRFREDLFYRLDVVSLRLPPLRDRREDVAPLAVAFLRRAAEKNGKRVTGFTAGALAALETYPWPGNVRELLHAVERAVILCRGETVDVADLPEGIRAHASVHAGTQERPQPMPAALVVPLGTTMEEIERLVIKETLRQTHGDKNLAAQILGIAARTIYRKLDRDEEGKLVEPGASGADEKTS